jgi:hypothetical protein
MKFKKQQYRKVVIIILYTFFIFHLQNNQQSVYKMNTTLNICEMEVLL